MGTPPLASSLRGLDGASLTELRGGPPCASCAGHVSAERRTWRQPGGSDLADQLVGHRIGKGLEVFDNSQKRARTANDVLPIPLRQATRRLGMEGVTGVRLVVDDREPVDR